ncbi:MAG: Endoribonuclease YbeY [Chlamydiia bacterium]|nr:Endoribonuclease YbeY [Chlamydiia bacterium]
MSLTVNISNCQDDIEVGDQMVEALIRGLVQFKKVRCSEICCYLVDQKTICSLHEQFFDDPSPTDTISFPLDDHEDLNLEYVHLGEIFVCPRAAIEYSSEHKTDPYVELSLYVVHGFLHLLGFDDITPELRRRMQNAEKSCMAHLEKNNLLLASEISTTYTEK